MLANRCLLALLQHQQRLRIAPVLLHTRQRLGRRIQLRIQRRHHVDVRGLRTRQLAHVGLLELPQLRILLIQLGLGIRELSLKKVRRTRRRSARSLRFSLTKSDVISRTPAVPCAHPRP